MSGSLRSDPERARESVIRHQFDQSQSQRQINRRCLLILTTIILVVESIRVDYGSYAPLTPSSPLLTPSRSSSSPITKRAHIETIHVNGGTLTFHSTDHTSYSYAYGPSGVKGLLFNKYALGCALFASLGGLEFGYDQGVIANILVMSDFMARFPLTPFQKGAMTACLELGALAGVLFTGTTADRHSRRRSIVSACIIFLIGSIFQTLSSTLTHLFIGRLLGGIGVGALSMLAPLYISEISPPEIRGSLLSLEQLSIVTGVVVGFWLGYWTRNLDGSQSTGEGMGLSWRIPLGVQIIPGLVLMFGIWVMPPSPRLLVLQGKHKEAKEALAKLRGRKLDEDGEFVPSGPGLEKLEMLEMRVEAVIIHRLILDSPSTSRVPSQNLSSSAISINSNRSSINPNLNTSIISVQPRTEDDLKDRKSTWWKEWQAWKKLVDVRYWPRTRVGVGIMFFQQWSGINALLYYAPTLLTSLGFSSTSSTLLIAGGIGITQLLAVFPAILVIDDERIGRRGLLRFGSIITFSAMLTLGFIVWLFDGLWDTVRSAGWVGVAAIYVFTFAYGMSFGPIGWVLPSEVFPLSMRSRGVALSTASNWANNFLVGLLTPILFSLSPTLTFTLFALSSLLALYWVTMYVPETANVALEEMDGLFGDMGCGVGREDARVRVEVSEKLGLTKLIEDIAKEYGGEEGSALHG
ncbi:hypothetical protein CVT24_013217 [Panaeolus cyanescens]|uniref:Major facilitator superfamily (MFS) profile domain-containing protein n=1 Tax=Panaeolus cyanescens TaxID=181874 RepID=A0A409YMY3_9AGAR|nr:hypothetical protein CVT24_013217 [Panaeolus cyanescens]